MSRQYSLLASKRKKALIRRALIDTLPVLMGYVTMGFAAGVLMSAHGSVPFPPFWAGFCGFAFVSGTLSFAIVPQLALGASLTQIALLTLCINFRYAFYGVSMIERWRGVPLLKKWFLIHSLADEIYALDVACRIKNKEDNNFYCICNHIFCVLYWVIGTTSGGIAGASLPIPSKGIEFAMVALFVVIFTDQMRYLCKKS